MQLLLNSERLGIHVDERVGGPVVPPAEDDPDAPLYHPPDDANILEARLDRRRFAPGVLGARRREPTAAAVEPAFRAADFAGASRPGLRQSDCLLDLRLGFLGKLAAPVEAKRAELLLDLKHSEYASLEGGLDPVAGPLQEIPPTFLAVGVALRRLGAAGGRMKETRMGLDQIDPPILHRMRHHTDLARARCSCLTMKVSRSAKEFNLDHQLGGKLSAFDWIGYCAVRPH